jgi:hypothetical protein
MASGWEIVFRVTTFLIHFLAAVFLAAVAVRCQGVFATRAYAESVTNRAGYPVLMNATCDDPGAPGCFYGLPQAYDVRQEGLQWNVWALLAAFEWLSASFALFYLHSLLGGRTHAVQFACWAWDVAGVLLFMPYAMPLTLLQSAVTALSLLVALISQSASEIQSGFEIDRLSHGGPRSDAAPPPQAVYFYAQSNSWDTACDDPADLMALATAELAYVTTQPPPSQARVALHYTEYCASASLLFVSVLILFVVDPLSWSTIVGYTGVLLCNLTGIMAHQCKSDQHRKPDTPWYSLDWVHGGNHFKLFMIHSWSALALSIGIIVYFGREALLNPDVPGWVRFVLWNLLVTYCLFGILATVCYALMGTRLDQARFDRWTVRLDYGLTALSVAAKLPIALTVYYGLVMQPGGGVC